jgi:ribosomal protein L12E/L44/L45/RPP1/RPP2
MKTIAANRDTGKGYAILFVMFLVALVIVGSSTLVLDQLTQGRRERETQMIWRGKQYTRAIRMYYQKFGRFPSSVDDLVKVQNGELRFLREAYTNPMNKEDGSWRFIYVTPAGQLIGSVQYVSLQQMAMMDQLRQMGLSAGAIAGAAAGNGSDSSGNDSNDGEQLGGNAGNPSLSNGNIANLLASAGVSSSTISSLLANGNLSSSNIASMIANGNVQIPPQLQSQLQSLLQGQNVQQLASSFLSQQNSAQPGAAANGGAPGSGGMAVNESSSDESDSADSNGQVIGGFIIGVAGKEDKPSLKVYKGGKTYKRWEFIFNPLEQTQTIGTISSAPQTGASGTLPFGQPPTTNQPPQPQPQQPQQQ